MYFYWMSGGQSVTQITLVYVSQPPLIDITVGFGLFKGFVDSQRNIEYRLAFKCITQIIEWKYSTAQSSQWQLNDQ